MCEGVAAMLLARGTSASPPSYALLCFPPTWSTTVRHLVAGRSVAENLTSVGG